MNVESLRDYCLSFPDATENVQWGADLVFKVGGKIFTVASTEPGETKVSFKCTPEEFAELVEQDGLKPADYVARYHWVTVLRWDALPDREIRRLVQQSYDLVRAKLPRKTAQPRRATRSTSRPSRPQAVASAARRRSSGRKSR
jgi:predicted DNA-binding protein (MmcQ/YjbR family)